MTVLAQIANEPIAGYKLIKRIGAGGYGEVWKAEAPGELTKALKFVYGFLDEDRASRELKVLSRIKSVRHPFLLSLERIEVVQGQLVIVTELADGSLKDRFEECKLHGSPGIGREELLVYMRDAADALDYMSEQHSLQHLDVKPENLLLVGGRIKVADFGLVKNLHEVSVSMLGGLTPLYAPPELFDGQPTKFSDQYSLAILYQEMLSGVLPFPGTSAAQLAAQHLHSRPRLSSLPSADQPVVARALSKDPLQRFPSCRAFVEQLCRATDAPNAGADANSAGRRSESNYPNSRTTSPGLNPDLKSDAAGSQMLGTEAHSNGDSGKPAAANPPAQAPAPVAARNGSAAPVLVPLAMPETAADDARMRPTLFIGIGGTGGAVLTRLRRDLCDRLGGEAGLAAFPMLLLDTDAQALQTQEYSAGVSAGSPWRSLAMPLRRPQDYRSDSRFLAQSTSRRWLYNIPRSLLTDGMRPLGRLALADHVASVCENVRATILQMLTPEAKAKTEQAAGVELRSDAPRVVLVASISGGTGSGMLLETAYAVRKVLCELGLPQELCGLLAHSTPRSQAGRDLAASNAVACLAELRQFNAPGASYPGDTGCGLPAFPPGTRTFDDTCLVYWGDQIAAEEFASGVDQLADYAYLNYFTPAGNALRQTAGGASTGGVRSSAPFQVRSFGLCRLGSADDEFAAAATEAICQQVADQWLGVEPGRRCDSGTASSNGQTQADADALAENKMNELGLGFELVVDQVQTLARQITPGVRDSGSLVGRPMLERALAGKLTGFAEEHAIALTGWLFSLVDMPGVRVRGAQAAAQWCVTYLRAADEKGRAALARVEGEQAELEAVLAAANLPDRGKTKGRPPLTPLELDQRRARIEDLKPLAMLLRSTRQVLQAVCGKVLPVAERLRDLARDVQFFGTQFTAPEDWDAPLFDSAAERDIGQVVRAAARQLVCGRCAELARSLGEEFQKTYLVPQGGIMLLLGKAEARAALVQVLRNSVRATVAHTLKSVDVAGSLLGGGKNREWAAKQLRTCVESARPRLLAAEDANRLLMVLPKQSDLKRLGEFLVECLTSPVEIVPAANGDVVICHQANGLSLERVARELAHDRPDYVEAASRLHTRSDISWLPLLTT